MSNCLYNERALVYNKVEQLNAIAHDGRTNWNYPEVHASMIYIYGSVKGWFDANGASESVCPWSSNSCCAHGGYTHYRNWDTPAPSMPRTLYFIHGAGCQYGQCPVYARLKTMIPDLIQLGYHTHDTYQNTREFLLKQVAGADSNSMFIGESLGGFWASQLASHFNAYRYLLNPVINPPAQMAQFVGRQLQPGYPAITQAALNTYGFAPDPRSGGLKAKTGLLLSRNDQLLDANATASYYGDYAKYIDWRNDEHSIGTDESFNTVKIRATVW